MKGKIRLKAKTKLKALQDRLGPKLGFLEVDNHEVSPSAVSSKSDLTTEPEPAPENPPEVLYSSEAKCGVDVSGKSQQAPQLQTESHKSLWDWAYDDLRHEDNKLIDAFESILAKESKVEPGIWVDDGDASRRQKQMSTLVDKQLADMDRKEWRIKVGEKSVNLRDQVDRIVKVVVVVKDLMSFAASLDPVHAGLPCAGVCLLLQLVVNNSEQRDAAADGLQYISMLVLRYAEIERIYLQGEEYPLKKDLETAVKELYRQILKYEAAAVCQFDRSTAVQTMRNAFKVDDWSNMLNSMKQSEEACEKLKDTVDTQDRRARTTQLESQLQKQTLKIDKLLQVSREQDKKLLAEIKAMREDQNVIFQTEVENKCLGSLRTTLYEETKAQNPDRIPGTCEWFLQHPTYREWLKASGPSLLWVTADPGCGKSVLSKFLVDDYTSRMSADTSVCYFFFKDNSTENRSAEHALCAILHQLFRQNRSLLQYAVTAYESNGEKLPISFRLLWSILMGAAADLNGGSIICVIDALDECAESSSEQLIQHLAEFHSTRNNTKMNVKFLVTSRPNEFIKRAFFENYLRFNQEPAYIRLMGEKDHEMEDISAEISLVIDERVNQLKRLRESFGIYDDAHIFVKEQLKKVENRTYLWISLIFPELKKMVGHGQDQLLEAVRQIPKSLDEAYERILKNSSNVKEARRLLHIVCAACRPLTLKEMNWALAVGRSLSTGCKATPTPQASFEGIVKGLCGSFINIKNGRVYLIHQTAREFLIGEHAPGEPVRANSCNRGSWKHSLEPTESNFVIARICISYLLSEEFKHDPLIIKSPEWSSESVEKLDRYTDKHEFLDYSSTYWANHVRTAKCGTAVLDSVLDICETQSTLFHTWHQVHWARTQQYGDRPNFTNLMVGSYFGLEEVVKLLLKKNVDDINAKDIYHRTPLLWAAMNGHQVTVKLLLDNGADPNSKDIYGLRPLSWAARNGHTAVVKLLLDRGATIDTEDDIDQTPLSLAAACGNTAVVKLLLDKGANPNFKDGYHKTPLLYAVEEGHEATVKLLLENDADVDSENNHCQTSLAVAARKGYEAVVKLLLDKGADPNTGGSYETWTPLFRAATEGHEAVVKLLLDRGANIDLNDNISCTLLSFAAKNGHRAVVELLLDRGVNIDLKDTYGWTPLLWAANHGRKAVVELLLDRGFNIHFKDHQGDTPLLYAAERGHTEVAKLLLEKGADLNIKNNNGRTPLSRAARQGHKAVVELLLDRGANIDLKNRQGETPLLLAGEKGCTEVVKLLLEKGADPNIKNNDGQTPLSRAKERGKQKVVEILLEYGAHEDSES